MKIIMVSKVHECMVDDDLFDSLNARRWFLQSRGYATARIGGVYQLMHRVVFGAAPGQIIDHIDRNKLNNQRSNLRLVTASQSQMNQGVRRDNSSGSRGISRDRKWWRARIKVDGKETLIGRFSTLEAAIAARDEAEARLFGEHSPRCTWMAWRGGR